MTFIGSDKIIFQGDLLSELAHLLIKLWVILDIDELLKWSKLFVYYKEKSYKEYVFSLNYVLFYKD